VGLGAVDKIWATLKEIHMVLMRLLVEFFSHFPSCRPLKTVGPDAAAAIGLRTVIVGANPQIKPINL